VEVDEERPSDDKEYQMLIAVSAERTTLTKEMFLNIFMRHRRAELKIIDVFICKLRRSWRCPIRTALHQRLGPRLRVRDPKEEQVAA